MKKTILILSLIFASFPALAFTQAHFLGVQAMIQILPTDFGGGSDPDSDNLYYSMNVPSQGSIMGPGKTVESSDKALSFVCGRTNKGPQCVIMVKTGAPGTKINPVQDTIEYQVSGAEAQKLQSKFYTNDQGEFHFLSTDGLFRVDVTAESFHLIYNGKGF